MASVLLLTPPFTQLNTPYPATAYLKGFLNTKGISSYQADLGIEVILEIFSKKGLAEVFESAEGNENSLSENAARIFSLREAYLHTIEPVIRFLQNDNPTLAYSLGEHPFLPEAARFSQVGDLEWAFGKMGIQDRARHLCTLYLEDLGDFIKEVVDPHFGFSRYAERLGRTATSFDELDQALQAEPSFVDRISCLKLEALLAQHQPELVAITAPFPGNVYGALRLGEWIKRHHPKVKIAFGGGYANTELRSLADPRIFNYLDFVLLDDGERPLLNLLEHLAGKRPIDQLKRTFCLQEGQVVYQNGAKESDIPFSQTGTPDYHDLPLKKYLSVLEVANPMHRLWSDGRWNKLTMAHGCYWKKCSFCDISLDYIGNYHPISASLLCDRMEELIAQTGETGFHFVDEAAPPSLMKELALEILRRRLVVSWWTNIRFEQAFTYDLCKLLRASGCVAVSGGLEVASDRLLELMKKGVTVSQVARVADHFTQCGILVHAYLMYGFPTQTEQETIDSLEVVRQLFEAGVLQSGFWHLFAMTSHSPLGLDPTSFRVVKTGPEPGTFADNDNFHLDPEGADHEAFGSGLAKSLFNYMNGVGLDFPLQDWFDFGVPHPDHPKKYIQKILRSNPGTPLQDHLRVVWLGGRPRSPHSSKSKKSLLAIPLLHGDLEVELESAVASWLGDFLCQVNTTKITLGDFRKAYDSAGFREFDAFLKSKAMLELRTEGLVFV